MFGNPNTCDRFKSKLLVVKILNTVECAFDGVTNVWIYLFKKNGDRERAACKWPERIDFLCPGRENGRDCR